MSQEKPAKSKENKELKQESIVLPHLNWAEDNVLTTICKE